MLRIILALSLLSACPRRVEPTWLDDAPVWERLPLLVEGELQEYDQGLDLAIKTWNRAAGCAVYSWVATGGNVTVALDFPPMRYPELSDGAAAGAYVTGDSAAVYITAPGTVDQAVRIVTHELGHVLGLAHDPGWRLSVMRPDVAAQVHEGLPMLVTHNDAMALRERYCRVR
jgi:hypothetical protein